MKKIYILLLLLNFAAITGFVVDGNEVAYVDGQAKVSRFYPNPANSFINFEFQKNLDKGHVLQIFSFIGNKVAEVPVSGTKVTVLLDDKGFMRGIYCFRLIDRTGKILDSGKFQVVK